MGMEPALCVNVNNDFGVVCLSHKSTFCSTCKHSSNCKHIRQLLSVTEKIPIEELPPQLQVFTKCEVPSLHQSTSPKYATKAISRREIPFGLSDPMKQCLKIGHSERFSMRDGTAYLYPHLPSALACPECAAPNSWSVELTLVKKTFLVTSQCCYPAEGTCVLITMATVTI